MRKNKKSFWAGVFAVFLGLLLSLFLLAWFSPRAECTSCDHVGNFPLIPFSFAVLVFALSVRYYYKNREGED
mgnify:CR=1 FL=1